MSGLLQQSNLGGSRTVGAESPQKQTVLSTATSTSPPTDRSLLCGIQFPEHTYTVVRDRVNPLHHAPRNSLEIRDRAQSYRG